jgi:tripartite-type tricarboxylate transporter receptor subunit TctC
MTDLRDSSTENLGTAIHGHRSVVVLATLALSAMCRRWSCVTLKQKRATAALLVAAVSASSFANAQTNYPERPLRVMVGFPAGAAVDVGARLLAQRLGEALGQPVIVENIAGAAGNLAADRVAKAAPDGYTLAFAANAQITVNQSLYNLPYDPVRDFAPISQVYLASNALVVGNAAPASTLQQLVSMAKTRPGTFTYASGGGGSAPHLAAELLKSMAALDIRHIPYKGAVAAIPDLLAGRVTMMFAPISAVLPSVREGKLRALAVTSLRRSSTLPDVPTVDESGLPGFEITIWGGLLAPAMTPPPIVRKLQLETTRVLALPDVRGKLAEIGMETIGNSPEEFAAVIKSEIPKWAKLIRESGIKADQ